MRESKRIKDDSAKGIAIINNFSQHSEKCFLNHDLPNLITYLKTKPRSTIE